MRSKVFSQFFGRGDGPRKAGEGTTGGDPASVQSTARADHAMVASIPPMSSNAALAGCNSLAERLWDRAYENLQTDDSSLVRNFEKILSRELETCSMTAGPSPLKQDRAARQAQLRRLIQSGLHKTEQEARVKRGIGDTMRVVLSAKGIVDAAVQAVPQAALAWVGVSLALGMLVNTATATETNREGIVYVITRMDWYWHLASLLLQENKANESNGLRHELERVVALYKALLSYQMTSVCSYYRHRGLEFLRDVVRLDDWDGSLAKIHDAESALRQDSAEYNTHQVLSRLERIAIAAETIETKLLAPQSQLSAASETQKPLWIAPFGRNRDFVGREPLLAQVLARIPPSADEEDCQRTAVEGLGGVGKIVDILPPSLPGQSTRRPIPKL